MSGPGLSARPVSAFLGEDIALPVAVADLNNLFEAATGMGSELAGAEVLRLGEYCGLHCPPSAQALAHFRPPA